ncbi:MAG: hypothetical protein WBW93_13940 [Steroidobacteraceae bacterium]
MAIVQYYPASAAVLMGLSTDTKPTNVAPGTRFLETDTGKVWMFYNTGTWTQVALIPTSGWTEPAVQI